MSTNEPPALPGEVWREVNEDNGWSSAYAVTTGEHGHRAWACYGLATEPLAWSEEHYEDAGAIFRRWAVTITTAARAVLALLDRVPLTIDERPVVEALRVALGGGK